MKRKEEFIGLCFHNLPKIDEIFKMFLRQVSSKLHRLSDTGSLFCACSRRLLSSEVNQDNRDTKTGGYAQAFRKFEEINVPPKEELQTFASLLKNSKFIDVSIRLIKYN